MTKIIDTCHKIDKLKFELIHELKKNLMTSEKIQIIFLSYVNDKNQYSNVQGQFGTMLVNNLMKMVPSCHLGLKDACYFQLPKS
jgi:hypothetical protein